MKLFVLLLVAVSLAAVFADEAEKEAEWAAFKQKFGKLFLSKGKEAKRKATFHKNHATLKKLQAKHEAGEIGYQPALYPFHDLDHDERIARMTGAKVKQTGDIRMAQITSRATLPVNYTSVPLLNPVKDQLQCGSCWTFSAMSALEAAVKIKTNKLVNLAEQYLVDCGDRDDYGDITDGCEGGWSPTALQWLADNGGAVATSSYPYTGLFGNCDMSKPKVAKPLTVVQIPSDATSIKNAIMKYGSLAIAVNADEYFNYGSGVFSASVPNDPNSINHAVNLVGWGHDNKLNKDYWLVRNSWNSGWGENGYIRLSTGTRSTYPTQFTFAVTV